MSGCAARLVHAGIPAVIAMTHSVLVSTAEQLFAEFYGSLFKGWPVARSLDEARHALLFNPERGTRLRGEGGREEITLELHDWFLPALYQSGADRPLLNAADTASPAARPEPLHNLPVAQVSGFFGRSKELWRIERVLSAEDCRRFSITGFGGQGKTALALEAGRWLLRTHLFERVCFISYAAYQGSDPVSMAVSTMSAVMQESLVDAAAAQASLQLCPTLLILDNLESLADGRGLAELLDVAVPWSEAGQSRVLLTSRQPDFMHPAYPVANDYAHQQLALQGLHERDAVDWFDSLRRLPPRTRLKRPRRDVLINLFKKVGFHPLSISLLAQQLKERGAADVGERLDALLEEQPPNRDDRSLLASLELSIERLPAQCRKWLPRLGVFQGGCLEEMVENVTGIEEADWQELRNHLLIAGLMQAERVPNTENTFLRFHPTLAPALWQRLGREEQDALLEGYWQAYYQLSGQLYHLDNKNPHAARALARCELSNLLRAVHTALQAEKSEEGVNFAAAVNKFLHFFGLRRDAEELTEATSKAGGAVGSRAWYFVHSNKGEQLWGNGQPGAATQVFADILKGLEETPSYNRCLTLHRLGRCFESQGQPGQAEQLYRQELDELARLEQSEGVRRQTGGAQTNLADVLCDQGHYTDAKAAYRAGLEIAKEQGDKRQNGVVLGQLGTLAYKQGELAEAAERYQEALALFQRINEPASVAVFWHQLGRVYQQAQHWEAAEQAYRQSARLEEELGGKAGLIEGAKSWDQLAQVCDCTGRQAEAEQWFRKALTVSRAAGNQPEIARTLNNLANLLAKDPARLEEARILAEEGLTLFETFESTPVQLWVVYNLLAQIAAKQGKASQVSEYRAKSKQSFFAFPGWRQQIRQYELMITDIVQATSDPDLQIELEPLLDEMAEDGWANLVAAIRSILNGERNEAALCEPLNYEEAAIIRAVLEGIAGQG